MQPALLSAISGEFRQIPASHFSPASGVLQNDPNEKDQSSNNRDLNSQLAGPFPTLHFAFALKGPFR
jgi:hypothetical protein